MPSASSPIDWRTKISKCLSGSNFQEAENAGEFSGICMARPLVPSSERCNDSNNSRIVELALVSTRTIEEFLMEERLRLLEEKIEVLKSENDVLKDPDAKTREREDPSKDIVNVWREKLTATASLTDKADEEKKEMVSLRAGDLVWFRLQDESQRGIVLGGWRQRSVLVKPDDDGNEFVPPLLIRDGIFRLCSRFNYRSKVEVSKITKAMRQSSDDDPGSPKRDLQFAKKRMASEAVQNAQLLKKLVRCAPEDAREPIHYGDVVQLQHVSSGLFLAVHKTPALQNPNCRKVSLKEGSFAAHFKIIPKFKVRSIGSLVYADDQIMLQSVKHELLYLGASPLAAANTGEVKDGSGPGLKPLASSQVKLYDKQKSPCPAAWHGGTEASNRMLGLRMPSVLAQEAGGEVNASMELRSFTVKIYRHNSQHENHDSLLTAQHWFRLFHPEVNAFVQASANADKGKVLDALGTDDDPLESSRTGGVPAHVPYMKRFTSTADASNPIHLSAKAVWCFEPAVDRATCVEVKWKTPLRIRHVPSGKYLSVDSLHPTAVTPRGGGGADGGDGATRSGSGDGSGSGNSASYFDAALVKDADPSKLDGEFGSPSSMVFFLIPTDAVTSTELHSGTSAIRVEHRSSVRGTLHLVALKEPKPAMLTATGGSGALITLRNTGDNGESGGDNGARFATTMEVGTRLCFTSEFSALHVLKIQPLSGDDAFKLNKLLSYIPLFKKYSFAFHAAVAPDGRGAPTHLCEALAFQCIELIGDLRKGEPTPPPKKTNMSEVLKEVNTLKSGVLPARYAGEPDLRMQKAAYEVKLLDAVFDATLSPYNYARTAVDAVFEGKYFDSNPKPRAVQKLLNVVVQRVLINNLMAQSYFSLRSAKLWDKANDDFVSTSWGDSFTDGNVDGGSAPVRTWELWRNIIMAQGEDTLGAMITLRLLLTSSGTIVNKLVNHDSIRRFQGLIQNCGPEVRLLDLFTAICTIDKRPVRTNQEMIFRKLHMNPEDSFSFGVGVFELNSAVKGLPVLRPIAQPDGSPSSWPRKRASTSAPAAYLGRDPGNRFKQLCIAWTGADEWTGGSGFLWFSPAAMLVGSAFETRVIKGVTKPVHLVPIEQLMWVVEPERLCLPCTGDAWVPFVREKKRLSRKASRAALKTTASAPTLSQSLRRKHFDNQLQLANYFVAQMELMSHLCKGRSYNVIAWLEKEFDYGQLMNIATNPHLPFKLIARTIDFIQALYVDRFPQAKNSGAPCLPEKLWVYKDVAIPGEPRRSATPVIQKTDLSSANAFPVFSLTPLSSVFGNPDPVLSHPDHFKFYLLRIQCNNIIKSFGEAGRMIDSAQNLNELGLAAIKCQQNLLKFGFQSTHSKLLDLCGPNGALLDSRSDLRVPGKVFDPPRARYKASSQVLIQLKEGVIATFVDVSDLGANFRLGQVLHMFQEKVGAMAKEGKAMSMKTSLAAGLLGKELACSAEEYLLQSTPAAVDALYTDFEAMFPGGGGEAAKLDLAVLASKPDLDQVLIDNMMYSDDSLMASALWLLNSKYSQRRKLIAALEEVTLLERVKMPCYGDVHALRSDLAELTYLARTSTVWGVKSVLSGGSFGDVDFGKIMHIIDKAIAFMYTAFDDDDKKSILPRTPTDVNYQGEFSGTDLQGNLYECTGLWSLDVALKWGPPDSKRPSIDPRCQDILRSCNLHAILLESLVIDTEIAWKGSICTEQEKMESERRLSVMKRALLVCSTAFVSGNSKNQEIMAGGLRDLEAIATPNELTEDGAVNKKVHGSAVFEPPPVHMRFPSICDIAQNLILETLRGNAPVCEAVSPSLINLFSQLSDLSQDVSTAPALDMLFILCKPEETPARYFQAQACAKLTAFESGLGFENLFNSVRSCLKACAAKSIPLPDFRDKEEKEDAAANPIEAAVPAAKPAATNDAASASLELHNPERLVRLVRVMCEGDNEVVAMQMKQSCGFSIDAVCDAIVSHIECCCARAVKEGNAGALAPHRMGVTEPELLPEAVLHLLSTPYSVGKSMLGLLVELVFLLPLNPTQVMSPSLWSFLQHCAIPLLEALSKRKEMNTCVLETCTDIVDVLEHVFIATVRLGLYEIAIGDLMKERIVAVIAEDVESLLENREKAPEFLKDAFVDECEEHDVSSLNKEQFVCLVAKLTFPGAEDQATENSMYGSQIERAGTGSFRPGAGNGRRSGTASSFRPGAGNGRRSGTAGSFRPGAGSGRHSGTAGSFRPGAGIGRRSWTAGSFRPGPRIGSVGRSNTFSKKNMWGAVLSPERRRELEAAFQDADEDKSGRVDVYEFAQLFAKVGAEQSSHNIRSGTRLGLRTVEFAVRFVAIRHGQGSLLAASRFSRQAQYGNRRKAVVPLSSKAAWKGFNKNLAPISEKFEIFQQAIRNNPHILGALERRRFSMLTILESGTPGPHEKHGRNLHMSFQDDIEDAESVVIENVRSSQVVPIDAEDKIRRSTLEQEEEDSALRIQNKFRTNKALEEHEKREKVAENSMSGAVSLGWEDVTTRFVRYVMDHFWSPGYDSDTCALIFETWNAHLTKGRTWALCVDGLKIPIADIAIAYSTYRCIPYELTELELKLYHGKQTELNRLGVTELLATVISSLGHDLSEKALPNKATELFNELLNGCNVHVQNTLYTHLIDVDTDGNFVRHMEKRLARALKRLVEMKSNGSLGSGDGGDEDDNGDGDGKDGGEDDSGEDSEICVHASRTARFLQLLCEGHHVQFQNYLRHQPMHSGNGDVNLIKAMCDMLVFLCESTSAVSSFSQDERDLVAQLLSSLADSMLGPCAGNQDLVAKSDVVAALNVIIHAVNYREERLAEEDPKHMGLRGRSCLLLRACLEGREDHTAHELLQRGLEIEALEDYHDDLEDDIRDILFEAKSEQRLPSRNEIDRVDVMQQFLVAVSTVLDELVKKGDRIRKPESRERKGKDGKNTEKDFEEVEVGGRRSGISGVVLNVEHEGGNNTNAPSASRAAKKLAQKRRLMKRDPLVGFVEISWRGKIERSCFPLPFEIDYLSTETKEAFYDEVDMSTSEKRVKALVKRTDIFVREMEIIYHFAEQFKVFRLLHRNLVTVKLLNYGLVFALNFNLLLSPEIMGSSPSTMLQGDMDGSKPLNSHERMRLLTTVFLSALSTLWYCVIIATLGITEIPVLIQELDELIREDAAAHATASADDDNEGESSNTSEERRTSTDRRQSTIIKAKMRTDGRDLPLLADEGGPPVIRDPKAWLPLLVGVACAGFFIVFHYFNFDTSVVLYFGVMLFVTIPCLLLGLRGHIGVQPANLRQRRFAIVYDCILRRSFFRNHIILISCCVLGFFQSTEYFSLELLDIILISPVIADIIKSVTAPGTALGLVFYLFCCSVVIFANFGISHFHEALQTSTYDYDVEEPGRSTCRTTLSCFYLIFYYGLNEAGNLSGVLVSTNPGPNYIFRIIADSIFFVWTGIVLMNIITGLMVDTFSSIREEKQSRIDILENDCFVCGILRNTYENFALSNSAPSFDDHLQKDHNIWTYVFYIAYLKKKDPTEDSGIETYVRSQLESSSVEWIPTRTGYVLETEGKTGPKVTAKTNGDELELKELLASLKAAEITV